MPRQEKILAYKTRPSREFDGRTKLFQLTEWRVTRIARAVSGWVLRDERDGVNATLGQTVADMRLRVRLSTLSPSRLQTLRRD